MFKCVISGLVLEDGNIVREYDGVKKVYRSTKIFQSGLEQSSIVEIKDVPDNIKFVLNEVSTLPVICRAWAQGGKYGVSFKFDVDSYADMKSSKTVNTVNNK